MLAKLIKHLITDSDNETYDTTRFLFVLSWISAIVFQTLHGFADFNLQNFGIGMGALTAAFGLSKAGEARVG